MSSLCVFTILKKWVKRSILALQKKNRAKKKSTAVYHRSLSAMGNSDKSHTNTITGEHLSCILSAKEESDNKFEHFVFSGMFALLQYLLKSVCLNL